MSESPRPAAPCRIGGWGNLARTQHALLPMRSRCDPFPPLGAHPHALPFGRGRSYGDSCTNPGAALIETRALDHFIDFEPATGVLTCEAGLQLGEILRVLVPRGWMPAVLPGTQYVTVGGAIANDVHGKNHHRAGTFGAHVRSLELLRSDGTRIRCGPTQDPEWFAATVGGLGLTGLITQAQLQLRPIPGPWLEVQTLRCASLEDYFAHAGESAGRFEYTVAWIDCLARGRHLGRGVLQRANVLDDPAAPPRAARRMRSVPVTPPVSLVNSATLRLFNTLHYWRAPRCVQRRTHYQDFFFPLDGIGHWNRLYGPRGFHQYQCVVPAGAAREGVRALLGSIARHGLGSFLAVLKDFGSARSPGLLSFPMAGTTLALDFPERGARLARLFGELDAVVRDCGGRLYPAKDARMPAELFQRGYPRWREFERYRDPRMSSGFWRRVSRGGPTAVPRSATVAAIGPRTRAAAGQEA